MTSDETRKLLKTISAVYPAFNVSDPAATLAAWSSLLEPYDFRLITLALQRYIYTNTTGFAPSISQLLQQLSAESETNELNESEAWIMVRRAIGRGNYYSEEDFAKFPPAVKAAVGSPSQIRIWASDTEYNEGVCSSNFKRAYRNCLDRERETAKIPQALRAKINSLMQEGGTLCIAETAGTN